MYEVFFNERKIIIAAPGKITISKTLIYKVDSMSFQACQKWFLEFVEKDIKCICLEHKNPTLFFEKIIKPAFRIIETAGGVVRRKEQILFIYRNGKWDLPKGMIDNGEKKEQAATREVEEECGIYGQKVVKSLPSTFHIYQSPYSDTLGEWILKETFWFEMEYEGCENGRPQTEEGITELRWFNKSDLETALSNTYNNLKPIIKLYLD